MLLESILVLAILTTGVIVYLNKTLYPRHTRLFRGKPKLIVLASNMLPILITILLIRSFTYEIFTIPSSSMQPTLTKGDVIAVDKYSFGLRVPILGYRFTAGKPQHNDVVVFRGTVNDNSAALIKRVVGLPGDHIQYINNVLYINGIPDTRFNPPEATTNETYQYTDLIVPKNSYFVLGDNRNDSIDSRCWGVLADKQLIGKARVILFTMNWQQKILPWQRIGKIS